jgi:RNA-dependent RNA polymerase
MDVGILKNQTTMFVLRSIRDGLHQVPRIVINLERREIAIFFQLGIFNRQQKTTTVEDTFQNHRLKLPLGQLKRIFQTRTNSSGASLSHIINTGTPPVYHRRSQNIGSTFGSDNTWRDSDTWFRQTDIVHVQENLVQLPISLRKYASIINIGKTERE